MKFNQTVAFPFVHIASHMKSDISELMIVDTIKVPARDEIEKMRHKVELVK